MTKGRSRICSNETSLPGAHYEKNRASTTTEKKDEKSKETRRKRVTTIREGEQEIFDEEFGKRDIEDNLNDTTFEAAPASATTPPIQRSVDLLPIRNTTNNETNIALDDRTIFTEVTEHSMKTTPRNNLGARDDQSIRTTATMLTSRIGNSRKKRSYFRDDAILSTDTRSKMNQDRRRLYDVRPTLRPSKMAQLMIDAQGRTMSNEEMKIVWLASGKCTTCGINRTHMKEKFGPFGVFRRMSPQTVEGISYKGYCLHCHDVPKLRVLLHDTGIPLDLLRHNPLESSIQSLQSLEAGIIELPEQKRSAFVILCSSIRFQIFCLVLLLVIAAAVIFTGIKVSKKPEVWISPAPSPAPSFTPSTTTPTGSPTSYEWNFNSEIVSDDISFGYKVKLSADGNILVVHAQNFENGKGRFDVYAYAELLDEKKWLKLDWVTGMMSSKASSYDTNNHGIYLSDDGSTVAFGLPGDGNGVVEIYNIDVKNMKVTSKGSPIVGPASKSEFGYSVALNLDGSRLFVGAPNYGKSESDISGLVRAYDYEDSRNSWIQVGSDMIGELSGSRFGNSVGSSKDGSKIVIGAPHDSAVYNHGGKIYFFTLDEATKKWYHYPINYLYGDSENSELGSVLNVDESGIFAVTSMKTSRDELFENAGVTLVCFYEKNRQVIEIVGYPISGTHKNAGLGYDVDMEAKAAVFVTSEQNNDQSAGSVQLFISKFGYFESEGEAIQGPSLGSCDSILGHGTSISLASVTALRLAIGYQCVLLDGMTKSVVHIYDYYAGDEQIGYLGV
jgi:hypothetical protein